MSGFYSDREIHDRYMEHIKRCVDANVPAMSLVDFTIRLKNKFKDAGDVEENKIEKEVAWKSAVDARLEEVTVLMKLVHLDVLRERIRQNKKWGLQRHNVGAWLSIIGEEFGEVCQAAGRWVGLTSNKPTDANDLYEECLHLAATALALAEQIREEQAEAE